MKAACLFLLLANLLFFGWSRWIAQPDAPPASESHSNSLPQLVLVNKTAAPSGSLPATAEGALESQTTQKETNARCSSIGPFQDVTTANQAATSLRGKGYEPRTRVVEGDLRAGLWVHLEDLPMRDAQNAMGALKQHGIADAYLMPSEDRGTAGKSTISLGIFSEPARAQRRAEEVRALGFKPSVTDRRKSATYWLDVEREPADRPIDPADLQTFGEDNGEDNSGKIVRLGIQACPQQPAATD